MQTGAQATMWSPARPFTEDELVRLDRWLDDVYADFTGKAAAGRDMPIDELEPLARGRVWTGADAHARGLVDELGGLDRAIDLAAELTGRQRADLSVKRYPDVPPLARLMPATHSDAPNAALATPMLPGDGTAKLLGALATGGPERLLAELATAIGIAPAGALSLPASWRVG